MGARTDAGVSAGKDACAPNKKSGPGFPAALPLFQPIRLFGILN